MEENISQSTPSAAESTPPPAATPIPPPKAPFGSWWKVGILMVGIILAASLFYAASRWSQKQAPSPTPTRAPTRFPTPTPTPLVALPTITPTADETANWKTFNEITYKFLIKYPNGWIVTPYDYKKNPVASSDQPQLIVSFVNKSFTGVELGTPGLIDIGIAYIKPKVSLTEFLTQEKNSASNPVSGNADISDYLVNIVGAQTYKVVYKYHDFTNTKLYIPKDESVYIITSQVLNRDISLNNEFDQILSTFQFLE